MVHHSPIVSRLAPTPSGYLHVGNLFNFVLTWIHVRLRGGKLILRIDDLDQARVRDRYLEDIFRALDWLQLDYDDGPADLADFKANYSQTLRIDEFHRTVALVRHSAQTFYCKCSRKDIERLSSDRLYQGTCKDLGLAPMMGETVLRLVTDASSIAQLNESGQMSPVYSIHQLMPYPVLIKKDGVPTYQIASLTEDNNMKVNFLVRGKDLWTSSLAQVHLANLAGLNAFTKAQFFHHDLIESADQHKLSKSQNAPNYERTQSSKTALISMVGKSMGVNRRLSSLNELLDSMKGKPL
jgi:glutamyl-tRNA synthetase